MAVTQAKIERRDVKQGESFDLNFTDEILAHESWQGEQRDADGKKHPVPMFTVTILRRGV